MITIGKAYITDDHEAFISTLLREGYTVEIIPHKNKLEILIKTGGNENE